MLGETSEGAYLLMEWIEPGKGDQRDLAAALANLHQQTAPQFGFRKDNYLGTLVQKNSFEEDWWTFFFKDRLESQISLAEETNRWNVQRQEKYLRFKERVLKSVEPKRSLHASCTETCGVVMCSLTSKGIQFLSTQLFLMGIGNKILQ